MDVFEKTEVKGRRNSAKRASPSHLRVPVLSLGAEEADEKVEELRRCKIQIGECSSADFLGRRFGGKGVILAFFLFFFFFLGGNRTTCYGFL